MQILDAVDAASLRSDIPTFGAGDTVKVHVNMHRRATRSRIQVYPGRRPSSARVTVCARPSTVRKISFQVSLASSATFPVHSPGHRPSSRIVDPAVDVPPAPSSTTCATSAGKKAKDPRRSATTDASAQLTEAPDPWSGASSFPVAHTGTCRKPARQVCHHSEARGISYCPSEILR
ncbi:50S ribosomal protein L19 [Microbacterium kyungheense]|uniref:50S ribosomal protein L19 n=1 Tax=Microbacterium kyungheense TaxID=1263636 RepID=UPI003CCC72F7